MKSDNKIIKLSEADTAGIGNKARHLARLMQHQPFLFTVPTGVVLLPGYSNQANLDQLTHCLKNTAHGPWAVRSCGLDEDGAGESMAGKFHTELFIEPDGIGDAIDVVQSSYGESADTSAVLIQEMINPDLAGVLFTRSPENYGLSSCEFCEGTADDLVSGRIEPTRVDFGRWSGKIYNTKKEFQTMLARLFLVGLIIEEKMGVPQDIEWAYETKRDKLYIIQSRDITSQLYHPTIANEQDRISEIILKAPKNSTGRTIFKNSAVREVVVSPTRITRSLVERLYASDGALGKAFELLSLPAPKISTPYVTSIFGKLYENIDVEKKLFGFTIKRFLGNRKLQKKITKQPEEVKQLLKRMLAEIPDFIEPKVSTPSVQELAKIVSDGAQTFIHKVYPVAYAATLIAQLAKEENGEASLTSLIMSDLSRLHHTGNVDNFMEQWGLRSDNDYELSEPRFCEDKEHALKYAANFADFPWSVAEMGDGFTHLKEVAKDMAIRWLYPLRIHLLYLEKALHLEPGLIFNLSLEEIALLANNKLPDDEIISLAQKQVDAEDQFTSLKLGDELSLNSIELLIDPNKKQQGLQGKMISVKSSFYGTLCSAERLEQYTSDSPAILLTKHLEPELVGLFPKAAGCLVDVGGALSHAAIVAREHSFPILVLPGASSTLSDGDMVEVSGDGIIKITKAN